MRLIAAGVVACAMGWAQWIDYPTAGVPKGKDGKPNLAAAAPRTADGKPDLSGIWVTAEPLPCPPNLLDDSGGCLEKSPLSRYAPDLNTAVPGGLPFQPWALEVLARLSHFECIFDYFRLRTGVKVNACNRGKAKRVAVKTYPL